MLYQTHLVLNSMLGEAIQSSFGSTFSSAVESAFLPSKHNQVKELAKNFIDGVNSPTFSWADFEVTNYRVNGAYIVGEGKILISNELKSNDLLLKKVLIEELGHWFDDAVGNQDSAGDEGDLFSRNILGKTLILRKFQIFIRADIYL